ncbi:class I SAM-dependent methyltransferase [Sorangium sp. So ce233]|uniref:class I SAM-dependent methyltransferase n=1 Tax=Sorangium sp. So ce233 TaxID=3133290 RepID=UPI003F5FAFFF
MTRTVSFDRLLLERLAEGGIDTILNLAAGLDTRPYAWTCPRPCAGSRPTCRGWSPTRRRSSRANGRGATSSATPSISPSPTRAGPCWPTSSSFFTATVFLPLRMYVA